MKVLIWFIGTFSCFVLPILTQDINDLPQSSDTSTRMQHFKFRSRKVGGKNIAVVSFKLDPERGRRSILVPDAEGLLHPFPFAPMRHRHRFLPPFEDEEGFSLNGSIDWDGNPDSGTPKTPHSLSKTEGKERSAAQMLHQIEVSLTDLEESLEAEKRKTNLESAALTLEKRRRRGRGGKKKRRKGSKEKKKGKKNKNGKGKSKKSRKSRPRMSGQEACQFKVLKKCAKKLRLLPKKPTKNLTDLEKCDQRKEFLECVEKRRDRQSCKKRSVARGDLPVLRSRIKKLFWTSSSCLLNESKKGR